MNLGIAPATGSPKGSFNAQDWAFVKFVLFHALIGVVLTLGSQYVGHFSYGQYTSLVTGAWSLVSALLTQYLNGK